jgi:TolB-like protein/Tfp pilus assembly protein PilF
MRFRIGLHVGDIIVQGDDNYGDGVNVAARLEALAEPGGICISRMVRDQLPFAFEDLGEQSVKNIARPVRVYALRPEAVADLPVSSVLATLPISQPAVAPRLSIVVLPFTNLSDDSDQQYFADGITEDLTTDLSRIAEMFVISRNTAFTYRNKPVDTKQIGRELGVRYVLEGSVRRSGSQVRVNAQLIDAATDAHLWTERFDCDTGDLFALQNEITCRLAVALNLEITRREAARATVNPDALDYILRGRAALLKGDLHDSYAKQISLFERALFLDPQFVEAQSRLAGSLARRVLIGLSDSRAADLARADELIGRALAASPHSAFAHHVKGQVLRAHNRWEEAIPEYETALASDPNFVFALTGLAWCKLYAGSVEEVPPLVEQAIRLSPRDPYIGARYNAVGMARLLQSRTDEAIVWFEKARRVIPAKPFDHLHLAAAYALSDDLDRAVAALAEARRVSGEGSFSSIARIKAEEWGSPSPKTRALLETTYFIGLRKAGLPEQ